LRWKLLVLPSFAQFSVSMMKPEQPVQFASQFQLYWRAEHPTYERWVSYNIPWQKLGKRLYLRENNQFQNFRDQVDLVIQLLQSLKSLLSKTTLAFPENFKPKEKPAKCTNLHWWKLSFGNWHKYMQRIEYV
jgi:hypothetical protein